MAQIDRPTASVRRTRHTLTRVLVACGITLGALALAGPSWAGPMMGC